MASISDIKKELENVLYPGFQKSIVEFGFLKNIDLVDSESCVIELDITSSAPEVESQLKK
jgi:ATP-binding protein involved in chromosome partitioning